MQSIWEGGERRLIIAVEKDKIDRFPVKIWRVIIHGNLYICAVNMKS